MALPSTSRQLVGLLFSFERPTGDYWPVMLGPNEVGRVLSQPNDILIPHATVSQHHATLFSDGTVFTIFDAGSTNGSFLNGQPLPTGVGVTVHSGDKLSFGAYHTTLIDVISRMR